MASETRPADDAVARSPVPLTVDTVQGLVAAREAAGMSSHEVAAHLKLAPRQVLALERADWAALPGLAFVRAALRSYGRVVRVGVDPLIASLPSDAMAAPELRPATSLKAPLPRRGMLGFGAGGSGSRFAWAALVVLVLVALVLFFGRQSDLAGIPSLLRLESGAPNAPVAPGSDAGSAPGVSTSLLASMVPALKSSAAGNASSPSAAQASTSDRPEQASARAEPVPVRADPATARVEPTPSRAEARVEPVMVSQLLAPALPTAEPAAATRPAGQADAVPSAGAGSAATSAQPDAKPSSGRAPELKLVFGRDAWVEIRKPDGRAVVEGLQRRDAQLRLPLDDELNLSIANALFVRLERDGRPIDLKPLLSPQGVARLKLVP